MLAAAPGWWNYHVGQGWHPELIQTKQKQAGYSQLKDKYTAKVGFNLLDIDKKEENLHVVWNLEDKFFGLRIGTGCMQRAMWEMQFYKLQFVLLYLRLSPCPSPHPSPGSLRGMKWSQFWHYFLAWNCRNVLELWKQIMKNAGKFCEGICSPKQQGETEGSSPGWITSVFLNCFPNYSSFFLIDFNLHQKLLPFAFTLLFLFVCLFLTGSVY